MGEPTTNRGSVQEELEKRLFHLKTLYDMSSGLFEKLEINAILRKFLLMTTGNFGVMEGFVFLGEVCSGEITAFICFGFSEDEKSLVLKGAKDLVYRCSGQERVFERGDLGEYGTAFHRITIAVLFNVDDRCRGLVCLGEKITGERYSIEDKDLLVTLGNNLLIAVRNARYAAQLKDAYEEVSSLNRAKDKVIHHLSHELKTPLSLIKASLTLLGRKLAAYPDKSWEKSLRRALKNVDRLMAMQEEVDDIMRGKDVQVYRTLNLLLDECSDQLAVLAENELGKGDVADRIRARIEDLFGPRDQLPERIALNALVAQHLKELRPLFAHREVYVHPRLEPVSPVLMSPDAMGKVVRGLIRNAVENTPEGGMIDVVVEGAQEEVAFVVRDCGVGITKEHQKRIFEGFFPTQETDAYCSGHPFDFNAGGKGADLLRMKIFSERYNFRLQMESERCRHIPGENDVCPGSIALCEHCGKGDDCARSGGTVFKVVFPISEAEMP
jgi:signal transduction histidine kinase